MSIWRLVRLDFGDVPVHFGELGIGMEETAERVRSDTLFGAWVNIYARLFGSDAVEELLDLFFNKPEPPVRMSSTFIYRSISYQKSEPEISYYLPKPLQFPPKYPEENDLKFFKAYKKLPYLPLEVWKRWYQVSGFDDEKELIAKTQDKPNSDGKLHKAGVFSYREAFKKDRVPKIAVDRATRATNLYHTGFVQFQCEQNKQKTEKAGLYFLLNFPQEDSELEKNLRAALYLLGEEGLGGERSSGAGRFKIEKWMELPEIWQQIVNFSGGTHHALMSLFWQKSLPADLLDDRSSYELLERGGWICSSFSGRQLRRKNVWMFAEGSVFRELPMGQLADVTPERFTIGEGEDKQTIHPVYRNGISLSLPIKVVARAATPK